jgi:hypothetical protein
VQAVQEVEEPPDNDASPEKSKQAVQVAAATVSVQVFPLAQVYCPALTVPKNEGEQAPVVASRTSPTNHRPVSQLPEVQV